MAEGAGEVLKRAHEAFVSGDMAALKKILSEDVVWTVPGRSQVSGTYRGHEEFFAFVGRLMELSGGTFRVERFDTLSDGDHAVNLDKLSATRDGRTLDLHLALVVHVTDGRITEAFDYFFDTHAWDDFWA